MAERMAGRCLKVPWIVSAPNRNIRSKLTFAAFMPMAFLAACQSPEPGPGGFSLNHPDAALPVMERVALAARSCWFRSNDPEFRAYRLAPELNSFTGRPRILIVPASNPNGRPLAVVQAEGSPAKVSVFGPLLDAPLGNRVQNDVIRWVSGAGTC